VIVELSTTKREIKGDGGNHLEKLGLENISWASQLTFLDMAGTIPDPLGNIMDRWSSKPN